MQKIAKNILKVTQNQHRCRRFKSDLTDRHKKADITIPEAKRLAIPWNEREATWKSTFASLKPKVSFYGPEFIRLMQTKFDFSPSAVKKWVEYKTEVQEQKNQMYIEERHKILGSDLAAAHFVVHRGGAIRFYGEPDWIQRKSDGSYILPHMRVPGLYVEAIDCNGMNLRNTGLINILNLAKLKWLSFANNPWVDDWTLDAISGSYYQTLIHLDVTNCPKITYRALSCFYRFQVLTSLVVDNVGPHNDLEFKVACSLLEDMRPLLNIKGIDYKLPEVIIETEIKSKDAS